VLDESQSPFRWSRNVPVTVKKVKTSTVEIEVETDIENSDKAEIVIVVEDLSSKPKAENFKVKEFAVVIFKEVNFADPIDEDWISSPSSVAEGFKVTEISKEWKFERISPLES
jgi:hypothetical protein